MADGTQPSAARRLGTLLLLAVVAGVLTAGLALPLVGGTGVLAKAGGDALDTVGSCPAQPPLAQRSVLLAADGSTIATIAGAEDRVIVPADAIPAVMQKAIVSIEDNRFYEHNGVDLRGLLRAASADTSSGSLNQGASTITEQYVKLAQVERAGNDKAARQAATTKSLDRKLTDARCAITLEKKLSKAEILTDYLNIAYFGEGIYGVGTAAEHYFGVPIQKVSLAQAALLAGLVNNPTAFDPVTNPKDSLVRRNQVLDALTRYDLLPPAQIAAARKTPVVVHPRPRNVDPCQISSAPVFCQYALDRLLADPKLGATKQERDNAVYEGGLKIYTSYDAKIQQSVDAGIDKHIAKGGRQVETAVVEQPGTGAILAIGQNRDFGLGKGQSKAVYAASNTNEVGSTFKLMTLTAALEQGIDPYTRIYSPTCYVVPASAPGAAPGLPSQRNPTNPGGQCPVGFTNAGDSESCDCNLFTGTWDSVNTFFVQLEERIGGPSVVGQMAKRLGVVGSPTFRSGSYGYSITLGSGGGFSAIDMATAYATIDAHGLACTPNAVTRITTSTGLPVTFTKSSCRQAIPAPIADQVTSILQGVLTMRGATAAGLEIGRPAAGKTGTVDLGHQAWFVGYVPQFVTAVGVFDPLKPAEPATPITDLASGTTYSDQDFYGATIPGHTWQSIMTQAVQDRPVQQFADPASSASDGYAPAPVDTPPPFPTDSPSAPTDSAPATGGLTTVAPAHGATTVTIVPVSPSATPHHNAKPPKH